MGDASLPLLLSFLPLPTPGFIEAHVLVPRGLVWRKSRASGCFVGVLVSVVGEDVWQRH